MKAIAFLAVTQAVSLSNEGYIKTRPHDTIGSRWGLKPTKTWIDGPGTKYDPKGDFAKAIDFQRDQEWHFAVDSIHQNADFSQVDSMDVNPDTIGS